MYSHSIFRVHREMKVKGIDDRIVLWQKYMHLQVFNELCKVWIKFMIVPTIFSLTCAVIVCFYVTIRNEGVPTLLAMLFFYIGASVFGTFFWILYQVIMVIRTAEGILGILTSTEDES